jgi:hypothetical protein
MYTALSATSQTLEIFLLKSLVSTPDLNTFFDSSIGGTMEVSLSNPQEMQDKEGLSLWLYRIVRDDHTLNSPPERLDSSKLQRTPLPFRLHYLVTPIVRTANSSSPETEQKILGRVLQALYDHPVLRSSDLQSDYKGTNVELNVRLEPLSMEEITKIWDVLDRSYQLSVSYEVSVVYIRSALEPEDIRQVEVLMPEYGVIVSSKPI